MKTVHNKRILPARQKEKLQKTILFADAKIRKVVLKQDIRQKVVDFFELDNVSRMCPSRDSL